MKGSTDVNNAFVIPYSYLIAERWKLLTEIDRAPYHAMAEEDKIRYQREMEEWKVKVREAR